MKPLGGYCLVFAVAVACPWSGFAKIAEPGFVEHLQRRAERAAAVRGAEEQLALIPRLARAFKLEECERLMDQLIASWPEAALYSIRAAIRTLRDNPDGALADCERALALEPFDADYLADRGSARFEVGDRAGALADLDEALTVEPRNPAFWMERAEIRNGSDPKGAATDAEMAISIAPESVNLRLARAQLRREREDYHGALSDVSHVLAVEPKNGAAFVERGRIRAGKREYDAALQDFGFAIEVQPEAPFGYFWRGTYESILGRDREAIRDLDAGLRIDPNVAIAFHSRSRSKRRLHDLDSALADIERALALQPRNADALLERGIILYAKQEWTRALADFDRAEELDAGPENPQLLAFFARSKRGSTHEARAELTRALLEDEAGDWVPVYRLLTGVMDERAFVAATAEESASERANNMFYVGWRLLDRGRKSESVAAFRKCREGAAVTSIEKFLSETELRRLGEDKPAG